MAVVKTFSFLDTLNECVASIDAPSKQTKDTESKVFEQVRKYFILANNPDDSKGLSEDDKEMIDFMESNLQRLTISPDRIRISACQLKYLFELPSDADIVLLLSTYYSCFYLADSLSESILTKKKHLIDELLCVIYHEIILELMNKKMSYDKYFSSHIMKQLRTSKDSKVRATLNIITKVAKKYNLVDEIITFLENSDRFYEITDNWPAEYLRKYMKNRVPINNGSFADFLKENQLEDLFNNAEIVKYEPLFKSYMEKLVKGQTGAFHNCKSESISIDPHARNNNIQLPVKKKVNRNIYVLICFF